MEEKKITKRLSKSWLSKYAIAKMFLSTLWLVWGGLGKTTLAQMAFNDERVKRHFELKIWVYVSQDFNVKSVIKTIIGSISGKACETSDLDSLQKNLREMLDGKRYLLVSDDAWDEDQEKWDGLKYLLACGSKGTSIIVTTRLEKVASIMGTIPPHHLPFLSEDDCWMLFRQRAFGHGNEEHPNLVAIGKEIVKKCGGVPLAAKALGGLMRFKSEEKEWLSVKESEIWNLHHKENTILPALRLSYYNPPLELRQCFAYCAIFLKGSRIEKENLIDLSMANGFISSNGQLELEDIGNVIWNELHWRSFFQDLNKDQVNTITCKMHDLMHDLAQSVTEHECHVMEDKSSSNISKQRIHHITLVSESMKTGVFPEALHGVESLRTIFQQCRHPILNMRCDGIVPFSSDFKNFGSLRVFNANAINMVQSSSSIGNSKHLRYLNLSYTSILTLPKSICSLHNLQTLNLNHCYELQSLPKNMKYLRSLRNLYLKYCWKIQDMPPKLGQLTLLKRLSLFVVGKSRGCRAAELQCLDLGGELHILHLERVRNPTDAKEANLIGKQNLRIIKLSWGDNSESESQANIEQILEALEPHPNVEELIIDKYRGAHFPLWMGDSILTNMVSIALLDCRKLLILPAFGQLASLQKLMIHRMDYVEYIDNDFPGEGPVRRFPSLEDLSIVDLPNLKGLSREEGRELLPRLHKISIKNCPKLTLPHLSSPENLYVSRCSNVTLSSISNLICLTSLTVCHDDKVISFPEEMFQNLNALESLYIERFSKLKVLPTNLESLVSLKSLCIHSCHGLESLPEHGLRSLKSLQHLEINRCNNLSSLSESLGHLTALEKLEVYGCPELVTLPESIKHLISLRHLIIKGTPKYSQPFDVRCEKLKTLPESLQHIPLLQSLSISQYPEFTSLPEWLGNLTSLQSLHIEFCCKISSLPHSFQSLSKLQNLDFFFCGPELKRRRQKGEGEDWHKIVHIPKVDVK
ncbi:disease resistance protein RGA2-like [Camellia sinensis]|uniref:disease resistance protein RGA2-like n=1 Tax=Camellia sinensis TaxID=4442 RepID=UPI001036EBF6|nr:disease resistance protein RGA2-like [Camellia sinensis]